MPKDDQQVRWENYYNQQVKKGVCPYSGYTISKCKQLVCDCFEFEEEYGVSQR